MPKQTRKARRESERRLVHNRVVDRLRELMGGLDLFNDRDLRNAGTVAVLRTVVEYLQLFQGETAEDGFFSCLRKFEKKMRDEGVSEEVIQQFHWHMSLRRPTANYPPAASASAAPTPIFVPGYFPATPTTQLFDSSPWVMPTTSLQPYFSAPSLWPPGNTFRPDEIMPINQAIVYHPYGHQWHPLNGLSGTVPLPPSHISRRL